MNGSAIVPDVFEASDIVAAFSTRLGGIAEDHLSSLNLSYSVSEDRQSVNANREIFFGQFGFGQEDLATAGQVHGTNVCYVSEPGFYPENDGLVTSTRGIALCITVADCAAVLLGDPVNNVAGACHAGWRGAAGRIVTNTIELMRENGADPKEILAYVSPCISVARFEVGDEVAARFDEQYVDRSRDKPHVDLKSHLSAELQESGLKPESIEISPQCTHSQSELFFSHRGHQGRTGRMMGFIALR